MHRNHADDVSILFIGGTPGCGITTLLKQLKIVNLAGFSDQEQRCYLELLHFEVLSSMKVILEFATAQNIDIPDCLLKTATEVLNYDHSEIKYDILAGQIDSLWGNATIRELFQNFGNLMEFRTPHAEYFLDNCMKYAGKEYIPTIEDILRVRNKNSGQLEEISFMLNKVSYNIVSAGTYEPENFRRVWHPREDRFSGIAWIVATDSYDKESTNGTNLLHDDLNHFQDFLEVSTTDTPILFFNKVDLAREKLT